jgi:hypothetical protein
MRWGRYVLAVAALGTSALCADQPGGLPVLPCGAGTADAHGCNPSRKELKQAKSAYQQGLKLQQDQRLDEAYEEFKQAAELAPRAIDYVTAREMARGQAIYQHMQAGDKDLLEHHSVQALAEFRNALHLDPDNSFAQQRVRDALGETAPQLSQKPQVLENSPAIAVNPKEVRADFHFAGSNHNLLTAVSAVYGVNAVIDDSVPTRQVRFDLGDANFRAAMDAATVVTHTMWAPLSDNQVIFAADTADNHKHFDRMGLRRFYIPDATTPQALNDIVNMLRSVFEVRFVTPQPRGSIIEVRAPQNVLDAATHIIESLDETRPQVMLDVRIYEINHSLLRNIGLHIPNQFNLFNIPAAALASLGGQNIQDLVNQLIAGGGINQGTSQALSGLLAQLGNQQNSVFSNPLATFGSGLTLFGLSLDNTAFQLQLNESWIKSLEHATMRAASGNEATLHVGSRYPILNASFAPIYNTPAIAQNIANNTFQSAFPSVSYEDLGLMLKAKPFVNSNRVVSIALEMQLRGLGTTSLNGVPEITNREYKGSIGLTDGEPAVIAGYMSRSEQRSLSGIPGFGQVPGLNKVASSNGNQENDDEILVLITPRIVSTPEPKTSEVWLDR